jgi:hypothetical protein
MSKHFVFTSYETAEPLFRDWMAYLIYGKETCPTTGRKHWQCHLICKSKRSIKAVIKSLYPCHVEISKDPVASRDYCKKEGDFKEHGTWSSQGERKDLKDVIDDVISGKRTIEDIIVEDPVTYHQYGRTLEKAVDIRLKKIKRDWMPVCKWIWGPTGTGKTRSVVDEEKDLYFFPYEKNGWWDNYEGQEAILFDDFRGQLPLNEILRICDRYDHTVSRRGRAPVPLVAKRIYFTSCKAPELVFTENEAINQLLRRVTVQVMDIDNLWEKSSEDQKTH